MRRYWSELLATVATLLVAPAPAEAHAGHCTRAETVSTAGIAGLVALVLFRPWRRRAGDGGARTAVRVAVPLLLAGVVTVGGCGGKSSTTSTASQGARPSSPATVAIVEPTANETTGPNVHVVVDLQNAKIVQPTTGPLRGDEGHLHLSVDGKLVSMAYGTTQDLNGLAPGPHTLLAEFVATDHQPFRNRPQASTIFTVQ
jgi:hypothetical protein